LMISICMARMTKQVKITAHLFDWDKPPLVRRETTEHGPKTSMPIYAKGGAGYMDNDELIRVEGRLRNSDRTLQEKHPLIIPKKYHIAYLLIQQFHQEIKHQGRLLTEGAIRLRGYWIVGAKRTIRNEFIIVHIGIQRTDRTVTRQISVRR
jgi:hypothetical protein